MHGYARFVMRGRLQAIVLIAMTAFVGLFFSPISYLAGASVALVVLRLGVKEALIVVAGSAVGVALLGMLGSGDPAYGLMHMLMLSVPVMMIAQLLRQTTSLVLTFQVVALLGIVIVLSMQLFGQHWMEEWRVEFEKVIKQTLEAANQQSGNGIKPADLKSVMELLGEKVSGIFGAVFVFSQLVMLTIARNWQARLYNPGGFTQEFHGLTLGKPVALVSLAVVLAGMMQGSAGELFSNMLGIIFVLYLVQFLAIAHVVIARVTKGKQWLVALYALVVIGLFVFPPLLMIMVLVGFADTWVNFRSHITKQA
ncbi:MAG: YybS family protein [Gammaproteobacteria bacterium]|nr:YybS family protein [Gammaproteobacteria bacterium]